MRVLNLETVGDYLIEKGLVPGGQSVEDRTWQIRELPGGVSNAVFRVSHAGSPSEAFVLKQARERLRVEQPWYCDVRRIYREVAVVRAYQRLLSDDIVGSAADHGMPSNICVPRVLFEDRENFLFTMSAASVDHIDWKSRLLAGPQGDETAADEDANEKVAAACGRLLGLIHAATWQNEEFASEFADQAYFDALRLDPFYRHISGRHADLRPAMERLIDAVSSRSLALVHGDFSPKNLLVFGQSVMLIDFEVGHFGDPAFDLGFFASHLTLKAFRAAPVYQPFLKLASAFWTAYRTKLEQQVSTSDIRELESMAILNFAGCTLARLDGKSPVNYLNSPQLQDRIRGMCRALLFEPPGDWAELVSIVGRNLQATR